MPSFTASDAALAVPCPQCQADAGDPCCSDDGKQLQPVHAGRIDELRRLVIQALDGYDREGLSP